MGALEGLGALQYVTSGLALVALIVLAVLSGWKAKLAHDQRILAGRSAAEIEILAKRYEIPTEGMKPDKLHEALMAEIKNRRDQQQRLITWGIVATVLLFILAALSIVLSKPASDNSHLLDLQGPLVSDVEWDNPSKDLTLAGVVDTNGHNLTINARRILAMNASIENGKSTKTLAVPPLPEPKDPPNPAPAESAGTPGDQGGPGKIGTSGQAGGMVKITAKEIRGRLTVKTSGQDGGNGGPGGAGARGGTGGQGKPSKAGIAGNCAAGPQRGLPGGKGGTGGTGGQAGRGGDGGAITVSTVSLNGTLTLIAMGGRAGDPGAPGQPGQGGEGGLEGALQGTCGSAGRNGFTGEPGERGEQGLPNDNGSAGAISVSHDGQIKSSSTGSLSVHH